MKILLLLLLLGAALCAAGDLELADGRVLRGARVLDQTPAALIVVTAEGVVSVPLADCLLETQAVYGYDPAKAKAFLAAAEAEKAEREMQMAIAAREREAKLVAEPAIMIEPRPASPGVEETKQLPIAFPRRATRPAPFGIELGRVFTGQSAPFKVESMVEYHVLFEVPQPMPQFKRYNLLVGEGSRRITGVQAGVVVDDGAHYVGALTEISEMLTRAYGRPSATRDLDTDTIIWRDGSLAITLEGYKASHLILTFRIPQ